MKRFLTILCMVAIFVATPALATQPECTGDRHYDEAGQCCPVVTTTTLPDTPVACPDPPPCPTVVCSPDACVDGTCVNGSTGTDGTGTCATNADCTVGDTTTVNNVTVTVNRCPEVKFPIYAPCRSRKNGTARVGDVIINGVAYKCPRRLTPHRYFVPQLPPLVGQ